MTVDQLENYLDRGNSFGINLKLDDPSVVSWILLSKQKPINRFFEIFKESDDPARYAEQVNIRDFPYHLWIAELSRDIYGSDRSLTNSDYNSNETHSFGSLNEVDIFLAKYGQYVLQLKWSSEIDFL